MTPVLSPRTRHLVERIFKSQDIEEAVQWLEEECGNNIPFCGDHNEYQMERIRFAVIKLSNGRIDKLLRAIDEACMDWRDLFMAADFGYDIDAHEKWADTMLKQS